VPAFFYGKKDLRGGEKGRGRRRKKKSLRRCCRRERVTGCPCFSQGVPARVTEGKAIDGGSERRAQEEKVQEKEGALAASGGEGLL